MRIMNKHFELLEFAFNSVYVDQKFNEIYLTFTAEYVCLCGMCSHVVVLTLSVRLSRYPMWMRVLLFVLCEYSERVRVTETLVCGPGRCVVVSAGHEYVGGTRGMRSGFGPGSGRVGWCYSCVSLDYLCRLQVHVSVYCAMRIHAHLKCIQCSILLHLINICYHVFVYGRYRKSRPVSVLPKPMQQLHHV